MNEALTLTFETTRWGVGELDYQTAFQNEFGRTGFKAFMFCRLRERQQGVWGSDVLMTSIEEGPESELARQVTKLFDFRLSNAVRRAGSSFEPFNWKLRGRGGGLKTGLGPQYAKQSTETAGTQLDLEGYCLPMKSGFGPFGFLLLFGGRGRKPGDLSRLTVAALEFFAALCIGGDEHNRPAGLTSREMDCLRWTAEGKTSSEISTIIDLSEHTVNHYLISAARKLDCVNRVQAVAKALRLGLF